MPNYTGLALSLLVLPLAIIGAISAIWILRKNILPDNAFTKLITTVIYFDLVANFTVILTESQNVYAVLIATKPQRKAIYNSPLFFIPSSLTSSFFHSELFLSTVIAMATVQVINFKGTFYTINWKLMIALATLFGLVDLALSFMPYFSFEITDILSVVELIVVTVTVAIQLLACTLSVQELNKQKTARQKNLTTNTFKLMEYKRHKADQIMMNFILSFMILNAATWVPYIISGLLFYARICGDNFINQIFYFTYNGVGAIRGCLQAIIINRAYSKVEFTSEQDNDNEDDVNDDKKKKSLEDATTQIQIDEKVTKYDNASTQIEILNPFQNESFGSNTPILEDAVQVSSPRQQIPSVWSPTTDSISFNRSMNRKVRVRVVDSFLPTLSGSNALNYPTNSILLMNQNHLSKIDSKVLSLDSPTRFNSFVRPVSIITPKLDMSFVSVPRHKAVDAIRNSNQSYAIKIDSPLATGDIYDSYLYENK